MKDGGPAFPQHPEQDDVKAFGGMTLRDYFAGKAVQGWLATFGEAIHPAETENGAERLAAVSYKLADAMLKEREK